MNSINKLRLQTKIMKFTYTSKEIIKNFIKLLLILFVVYLYFKWPFYNYLHYAWSFWLWLAGLLILVTLFSEFTKNISNRIRGEDAEEQVTEKLEDLPNDFIILPNLVIGNKGNIDNVVIGPTGIWTIEVKSHSGQITFDGVELRRDGELFETNFLKQAWAESYSIKDVLEQDLKYKFTIQPVIVFSDPNATLKFGLKKINGIYVIGDKWLNNLIKNTVIEHLKYDTIDIIESSLCVYCEK